MWFVPYFAFSSVGAIAVACALILYRDSVNRRKSGVFVRVWAKLDELRKQLYNQSTRDPSDVAQIDTSSLLFYYGNIHSQRGQDGILAEIFRRLGIDRGRFVEFGAWDGLYLCNCRWLYEKGWGGVFIEGDANRFGRLGAVYSGVKSISAIHAFVGAPNHGEPGAPLIDILQSHGEDVSVIDMVSIDVDGPDLEILLDMGFSPPVVLLEGGFDFTPYLTGPARSPGTGPQHGLAYIQEKARQAGYEIACFYQDAYLVHKSVFGRLNLPARSAVELYRDALNFMPHDHKRHLLRSRSVSPQIRTIEEKRFGVFHDDPLHEDYAMTPKPFHVPGVPPAVQQ